MALLSVEGLSLSRGGRAVLDDVSFDLAAGEILVLIGPNGAGKTTLIESVSGLRRPDRGIVRFDGLPLVGLSATSRVFSVLLDEAELPAEARVRTLLSHAAACGGADPAVVADLQEALGLSPLLHARAGELSRGERRRVALFVALCPRRPVILLDEPLGVFDPLQLRDILRLLRSRAAAGTALLLSVHQLSDAEKIADRCLLLSDGRVLGQGTLEELRASSGRPGAGLEEVFLQLLEGGDHAAP